MSYGRCPNAGCGHTLGPNGCPKCKGKVPKKGK